MWKSIFSLKGTTSRVKWLKITQTRKSMEMMQKKLNQVSRRK
jgi:hypothetical protein